MQPVTYRRVSATSGTTDDVGAPPGASWVRFGDELLLFEAPSIPPAKGSVQGGLRLQEQRADLNKETLHVVVQNGRMFQQEHPEVPVIVDRGRFLLVEIDPPLARRYADQSPTCYGVMPLAENQTVFDTRSRADARRAPIAWIEDLVNKLSRPTLEEDLTHLTSFPTRHSISTHYAKAARWARGQMKALGYTARLQKITVGARTSWNVIGDKRGSASNPRQVVLVTAHLDSINIQHGPDAPAPGADDNGSGSAGLLEMMRALRDHKGERDLRFILFGGEEEGLFGSQQYVAGLSASERARISAVVNMDMIGTLNSPTRSVLLEGAPLSQTVIDGLSEAASTYTGLLVETSLNPFASDHVPFIRQRIPAVLTIEGADNANGNIHSDKDTIEHIAYDFALDILRMNVAYVASEIGAHHS